MDASFLQFLWYSNTVKPMYSDHLWDGEVVSY